MKLECSVCGAWYGSKVWQSNDKSRSIILQRNNKYKIELLKTMPHLTSAEVKSAFASALHTYMLKQSVITKRILKLSHKSWIPPRFKLSSQS